MWFLCFLSSNSYWGILISAALLFLFLTSEYQPLHKSVNGNQAQHLANLFMLRPVLFLTVLGAVIHIQAPGKERWGEKQCSKMRGKEIMQGMEVKQAPLQSEVGVFFFQLNVLRFNCESVFYCSSAFSYFFLFVWHFVMNILKGDLVANQSYIL